MGRRILALCKTYWAILRPAFGNTGLSISSFPMAMACWSIVRRISTSLFVQAPFAVAHLKDQDVTIDFSEVTTPEDRVAMIATLPLTDNETWTPLPVGSVAMFAEGVYYPG